MFFLQERVDYERWLTSLYKSLIAKRFNILSLTKTHNWLRFIYVFCYFSLFFVVLCFVYLKNVKVWSRKEMNQLECCHVLIFFLFDKCQSDVGNAWENNLYSLLNNHSDIWYHRKKSIVRWIVLLLLYYIPPPLC